MAQRKTSIIINKVHEFNGHRDAIYTFSPSWKNGFILSAGAEGLVAEWNIDTGIATAVAKANSSIYSILCLPERNLLVLGLGNGSIQWIDFQSKKTIKALSSHTKGVFDLMALPDGNNLLSSGEDGTICHWDLDKLTLVRQIKLSDKSVRTMTLSPDNQHILVGSSDHHIYKLKVDLQPVHKWKAHLQSVFRLKFDPETGLLFSVGRDAHIRIWDPRQDYMEIDALPGHNYAINDVVFSPNGNYFFTGSMDKTIKVWDSLTFKLLKVIDPARNECHKNGVNRLMFSDGLLFSCGDDRKIMGWKIDFE